ncbi:MAG: hypothetical protein HY362_04890 [Candidatus Aenigmarchaeota archaeon]|nr:hypothetical protein [Candidatus Aenigmarchaeota archaeon]
MLGSRKTLIFAVLVLSFVLAFSSIGSISFALDKCTTAADCYKSGAYYCTCNGAEPSGRNYCIVGESWRVNNYHCSDHVVSNDLYTKYCVLSSATANDASYTCANGASVQKPATETSCADGKDDDYDGTIDCSDSDCSAATNCATTTTTTTTTTLATTTTSTTTTTGPASITVTSPNGGETWRLKDTVTISWTSSGVNYVYIDLLDSSGTIKVSNLVNVNGNPGTTSWTIPEYVSLGSYKVRVSTCPTIADRNSCYENSKSVKDTSDGLLEIKPSACIDSDNGNDINTKGTVTVNYATYTDYCSGNSVIEYYCGSSQATSASSQTQTCASGYSCSDGHCIAQSTTTTTTPPYSGACTDSDGGINSNTNGVAVGIYGGAAAGYNAIYGQEPNPNTPKSTTNSYSTYYDYCATSTQLNEGFCDSNGKLSSFGYQCSYGCNNGVCLPAPATTTTTTAQKKYDGEACTSPSECTSNYCSNGYCGYSGCPASSKTCPDGTRVTCSNSKDTATNACRTDCYIPTCPSGTTTTYYTATTMACSSTYPSYCNSPDQCKGAGNNWCTNSGGGYCTRESCPYCQSAQSWNCYNEKDCKEIGKSNWCYPSGGGSGYCTTASCPVTGPPTTITPSFCGNGFCEYGETPDSCSSDCKRNVCPAVSYTDDLKRKCSANGGTLVTPPPAPGSYCSPQPTCSVCGNNICEFGETTGTCAQDCGKPVGGFVCGNNRCEQGETSFSCPADCTQISFCGNLICESGEERSCPGDCKAIDPPPGFYCPAQAKEYSKPTWDIASGAWCCTEKGGKAVGACSGSVQGTDRAILERCVKNSGLELYVYTNPSPTSQQEDEAGNHPSVKQATLLGNSFNVLKDLGRVVNCYEQPNVCAQKGIKNYPTWVIYNIPYGRIIEQQELGTLTGCSQFGGPGGTGPAPPPSDTPSFMFTTDPIEFLSAEALRHIKSELPPAFIDSICKNPNDIKEEIKRRTLYELSVRGSITDMCTELQKGAVQCDREIEFRCKDMKKKSDEFCSGREECRPFVPTESMIDACKNSGGSFVVEKDQTGCANIPRCQQSTEKGIPATPVSGAFVLRNGEVLNVATGLQTAEPTSVETFDRTSLCSTFMEKARFVCNELPRQCKAVKERAANCDPDKFKPELVAEKVADRVTSDLCKFKDYKIVKDVSQISVLPVVLSSDKKLTSDQITKVRGLTIKFDDAPLNLAGVYIYRGTAAPNRLGDLRRLEFLSDVDVDHVELSSAPAEKGSELKNFVGKLETMKELEKIPTSLQPRVSESQNDILEVSAGVEQVKNKSADVGYALQQFFGMVAEQERKDSIFLREKAEKLREIATNLQLIADSVGNVDARASLSEQISFLKEQADQYDKDANAKEAWSGGILSYFSQLFSGGSATTTTTTTTFT